ncbi:hypothetical protein ACAG26_13905 [Mycobacterium sp. pUA109]|uniref:Rv1893 family protein n=1 Tax=Mycobacterium sp. pUA109 TaxID=3238982 RepID=UPI00351AD2B1
MAFNAKDAVAVARDIATHAVQKASDIVEDASHIIKGDVGEGTSAIVSDSISIGTYAVDRVREAFTGNGDDAELEDAED